MRIVNSLIAIVVLTFVGLCQASASTKAEDHNGSGLDYFHNGRFVEAEAEFRKAAELDPKFGTYTNNIALACYQQGRFTDAIDLFNAALKLKGNKAVTASTHVNLANAYFANKDFDDALKHYRFALALNPAKTVHRQMVNIAFELGSLDSMMQELEVMVRTDRPDGVKEINGLFLPELAILHAYALQGKFEDVIQRATKDLQIAAGVKTDSGGNPYFIPTPWAIAFGTTAKMRIDLAPVRFNLHYARAEAYWNMGLLDEAMVDFKKCVVDQPSGNGYFGIGMVQLEWGNPKETVENLERHLHLHPKDVSAQLYYAATLHLSGNLSAADNALKQAHEASKSVFPIFKFNYELLKAQAFVDQVWGRNDLALTGYQSVLKACPNCGQALRNSGEISLLQGDKTTAEVYLSKAAHLMPNDTCTKSLLTNARASSSNAAPMSIRCAIPVR